MGQDEPDPKPEGEDPGTVVTEGDQAEVTQAQPESDSAAAVEPEPEGEDPGQIETFSLDAEREDGINLSEEK